ncbi:uncharacterized protein BX663DRAFT_14205 [Cokeromyces recurvatus]|uniref:uncharacterized protein n=1 Tax=Cokeromyces recurvatus TaxID=90255 RepID=UPI00221E9B92|nr:uncharacterized protein BX663DRAFT_14205 [Cokeromyces recurvatus]KAI7907902.1 hypothetical protein BX663DRAFT_14205 [Cokeromyces recurvatus]
MSDPHHQLKNSLNYFQHTSNTENSIDPIESNSSTTYSINIENPLESTKRTSFSIAKSDESNQLPNRLPTRDTLATSSTPSPPQQKNPSILQRLIDKAKLPEFHQMRKTIKASFALLIAMVFIFDYHTRKVVSSSVLLVGIVTIFYFPVRTIGIQTEVRHFYLPTYIFQFKI